jgi:hypothetical protein
MDPVACWRELCDALLNGDPEVAAHRARDLHMWFRKGGFLPREVPYVVWQDGALLPFAQLCEAVVFSVKRSNPEKKGT